MTPMHLPADEKTEYKILGFAINSIDAATNILYVLKDADFYYPKNLACFSILKTIFDKYKLLDLSIIHTYIKEDNATYKSCGGIQYFMGASLEATSGEDYEFYLTQLRNLTALRKLILSAKETINEACKPYAHHERISKDIFKSLYEIEGISQVKTHPIKDIFDEFSEHGTFEKHIDWMRERKRQGLPTYTGVETGFTQFDQCLGFLKPGALYYIGARTSMGKTTFMMNLIKGILSQSNPASVGLFSLEMPANLISAKLLCMYADVWFRTFEDMNVNDEQFYRLEEVARHMRTLPLFIEDQEDLTISKVRMRARRMVQQYGVKIIFIDYLTRIKSDTNNPSKHLQVDEISKGLQSLAKELNIPVVCLAQLNRKSLDNKDSRPTLADFRESGSIEEDADGCLMIHRPEYYDANNSPGITQIIVAKNRIRGQLMTIDFGRSSFSEAFFECKPVKKEIEEITRKQFLPFTPKDEF